MVMTGSVSGLLAPAVSISTTGTPLNHSPATATVQAYLDSIDVALGSSGFTSPSAESVTVTATPANHTPASQDVEAFLDSIDDELGLLTPLAALAQVATSGSYLDLSDRPTSMTPTVSAGGAGHLLYHNGVTWTTLPPGGVGTVMVSTGTALGWTEQAAGGGGGTPDAHAASHQHGGTDEVATATPAPNVIPKTGTNNFLAMGFLSATVASKPNTIPLSDSAGALTVGYLPGIIAANATPVTLNVASGSKAVAIGSGNVASGTGSMIAGGSGNAASGTNAFVGGGQGDGGNAAGQFSAILGGYYNTIVSTAKSSAVVGGECGKARWPGHVTTGGYQRSAQGDSQAGYLVMRKTTTDGSASELVCSDTTSKLVIPEGMALAYELDLLAHAISGSNAGKTMWLRYHGVIRRASGGNVALKASAVETIMSNSDSMASTWTVAVTADTGTQTLKLGVTGEASNTINWVAKVKLLEAW